MEIAVGDLKQVVGLLSSVTIGELLAKVAAAENQGR
jgi:hypothetical protein